MSEELLFVLAGIIVIGTAAQWIAWRVGIPSILLLLVFGLVAGPGVGWLNPDKVFGELLFPVVSLSVALILFEGGLTLKFSDLKKVGSAVVNLVTIGALITCAMTALAAKWIIGFDWSQSALIGGVLIVTGPTVISPLLRHIRPSGATGSILKWEGIVIDPIGALVTVLIYEAIMPGHDGHVASHTAMAIAKTVIVGGGVGVIAAWVLAICVERFWIADHLQVALSIMLVFAAFTGCNMVQHESGLLAVTVMGIALANQKRADVEHILEFKENLQVLLISTLFVVLAARLQLDELRSVGLREVLFVGTLILLVRPVSVLVSTLGSPLSWREKWFLAAMAPRGIVAAAIASVFAIRLEEYGSTDAARLVPVTFVTIILTVAVYGLVSPFIARRLKVAESNPQGILFGGASPWVCELARWLQSEKFAVRVVDRNRDNVRNARMAGITAYQGSVLSERMLEDINLGGIGKMFAVTPNDWVNVLAVHQFERVFGKANCFQIRPRKHDREKEEHRSLYGRSLFTSGIDDSELSARSASGARVKGTKITDEFGVEEFERLYGNAAVPLLIMTGDRKLSIITDDSDIKPEPGSTLVSLVRDPEDAANGNSRKKKPATSK